MFNFKYYFYITFKILLIIKYLFNYIESYNIKKNYINYYNNKVNYYKIY